MKFASLASGCIVVAAAAFPSTPTHAGGPPGSTATAPATAASTRSLHIIIASATSATNTPYDAQAAMAQADSILVDLGLQQSVSLKPIRRLATGADLFEMSVSSTAVDAQSVIRDISNHPGVRYAEPDRMLQIQFVPNDPMYASQWHYFEATAGINLPAAWDLATGAGATAAVLDTGYRPHVDLVGPPPANAPAAAITSRTVEGYDFIIDTDVSQDGDGRDADATDPGDWVPSDNYCYPGSLASDSSWHGTHVSGTVAALTDNSVGVAGIAYNATLIVGRVLGRCGGYTSDIADAIIWAAGGTVSGVPVVSTPADVINMSLGGQHSCDVTTQTAINTARGLGAAVVVSAGNSNLDASGFSPASCAGVINVGAVGRNGARAYYSNFGTTVDVAAPGGSYAGTLTDLVLSTLNAGTTVPAADSYDWYQGTSMAAPHVAGIVALMRSVRSDITPDQIECVLKDTVKAFPSPPDQLIGSGIVDANAAVLASINGSATCGLAPGPTPTPTPTPTATPTPTPTPSGTPTPTPTPTPSGTPTPTPVPTPTPSICVPGPFDNVIDQRGAGAGLTIVGLDGVRNVIYGTAYADSISGGNMGDCIDGGGGNDRINGRGGNDTLVGGDDADYTIGGPGYDQCDGEQQISCEDSMPPPSPTPTPVPTVTPTPTPTATPTPTPTPTATPTPTPTPASACVAGPYDNIIDKRSAGAGSTIIGLDGVRNVIYGSAYADSISGGNMGDCIDGGGGNDRINGRSGDDVLIGGADTDTVIGSTGYDQCDGEYVYGCEAGLAY